MRTFFATAAILALTTGAALAADPSPIGDWLVKDGYANIRIDICAGRLWGIVAWEKTPGGVDKENPDAAKKGRPTLGMPIILGFAPTKPNRWEGEIYNSENGKLYSANVSMADENTLELEGCLVWPLCQTQKWTRVTTPPPNAPPLPPIGPAATAAPTKTAPVKGTKNAPPAQSDVCARVPDQTGSINGGAAKQTR
jgi:uncharacterized protein (DUF2147 family)